MANRDHYEALDVGRTVSGQEIQSSFEKLVAEFHAAGKPKTIDDVEWLRVVTRACRVLGDNESRQHYDRTDDDSSLVPATVHGYDQEFLKQLERTIDNRTKLQRNTWLAHKLFNFLNF
ncbi:MAG: DnaJ domain-containing protein [Candidatus Angelobacter sp.]